jgi:serine/threonine protein kinase
VLFRQPYREKSDIWSLGHLIYELCAQEWLFNAQTMDSLVEKHDQPYKGIDTGYYSEALACTVAWMLTRDSELRPSAQEVLSSPFVRQLLQEKLEEHRRRSPADPRELTNLRGELEQVIGSMLSSHALS